MPRPPLPWPSECPCCGLDGPIQPRRSRPSRIDLSKHGLEGKYCMNCTSWLVSAIKKGCDPKLAFERRRRKFQIYAAGLRALAGT